MRATMSRVLLIDDNPHIRRFGRLALEGAGFDVDEAVDGAVGLRLHRAEPYDAIVCDLLMPERDGLETLRALRGAGDPVPVVAISGGARAAMDYLPVAARLGATEVLHKPFGLLQLIDTVRAALTKAESCGLGEGFLPAART
jgi:two-component system, chemotaxis family, chemotaxis protein CheY